MLLFQFTHILCCVGYLFVWIRCVYSWSPYGKQAGAHLGICERLPILLPLWYVPCCVFIFHVVHGIILQPLSPCFQLAANWSFFERWMIYWLLNSQDLTNVGCDDFQVFSLFLYFWAYLDVLWLAMIDVCGMSWLNPVEKFAFAAVKGIIRGPPSHAFMLLWWSK